VPRVFHRSAVRLPIATAAAALLLATCVARRAEAAPGDRVRAAAERVATATGAPLRWTVKRGSEAASFVRRADGGDLLPGGGRRAAGAKAADFVARHPDLFGLRDAATELRPRAGARDHHGWTHPTWDQVYAGVEVFGAVLRAHVDPAGALRSINGATVPIPAGLATTPAIAAADAERIALAAARGAGSAVGSRLAVYATGLLRGVEGEARLAHAVEVSDDASGDRDLVFVDALDGRVLDRIRLTPDALSRRVSQTSAGNLVWSEGNPDPIPAGWAGGTVARIAGWQDEIDGARDAYDLIASLTFGTRLSYDGADAVMGSIHDATGISCPNANWNGYTTNFCQNVTSDDVVAHEWGHAYTERTSGLVYAWQAGALNESHSDVWGETADLLNARGTDSPAPARAADGSTCSTFGSFDGSFPATDASYRWLMGEDSSAFGTPIRDMWHPECRSDPGRVGSSRYWCDSGDGGGVHTNSGVPNHLYALLVDGGIYNGHSVAALGIDKAASIVWRAISVYETPVSDFADHADAVEQSCADLVGVPLGHAVTTGPGTWATSSEVIAPADCAAVAEAVAAVELRADAPCPEGRILEPNAPALCSGAGAVETVSFSDFESTLAPWTAGTRAIANPATYDGGTWARVGALPDGRPGSAAFAADPILGDCIADDESGVSFLESPPIGAPADRPILRLAFDHWIATEPGYDGGNLKVSVNGGPFLVVAPARFSFNAYNGALTVSGNTSPLAGESAWSGTNSGSLDGSWGQSQVDLSGIASPGDTVRFRFELGMDGCNGNTGWYVDDVRVYTCSDEVAPPPPCPNAPVAGCKATPSGRSVLLVGDSPADARDKLTWTWSNGDLTTLQELGDPRATTSYAFCVWDGRAGVPSLVAAADVPAGARWAATGTRGFRYSDSRATSDGIAQVRVKTGVAGKAMVSVKAKGAALQIPAPATPTTRFAANPDVVVQLLSGGGVCWESRYAPADFSSNALFVARAKHVGP